MRRLTWQTVMLSSLLLAMLLASGCNGGGSLADEVISHNILGTAYLGQQKWSEAEEAFRAALKLRSTDPLLLNNVAVAANQQGKIDEADALLRQALEQNSAYPYAHFNLGLLEKKRGNFEPARDHFLAVEAVDSADVLTQYNLGIVLSRTGEPQAAETAFRNALSRNPTHVSSLYGLGRLLMTGGNEDEGAAMIRLSQEIRERSGLDSAVGSQYGEEGPYAMGVDYDGSDLEAPAAISVTYERTDQRVANAYGWYRARNENTAGDAMLVAAETGVVFLHEGDVHEPVLLTGAARRVLMGDVNNDGVQDLLSFLVIDAENLELGVAFGGNTSVANYATNIPKSAAIVGGLDAVLVDRDHDGDLDLFACWSGENSGCLIATNDSSGGFDLQLDSVHGFEFRESNPIGMRVAFSDFDNDRDVDLLAGTADNLYLYSNQRDDTYSTTSLPAGAAWRIADLNKDGWMDLLRSDANGLAWHPNLRGKLGAAESLEGCGANSDFVVLDHDNDGFLDVACASATGTLQLLRNLGTGRWEIADTVFPDDAHGTPRSALDADGDGDLDLIVQDASRSLSLWNNEGGNANGWIQLDARGIGDNRFGVGAKVEVLAGALRQKFELVDGVPLHVGLGKRSTVQSARYLWPGGVLQDETSLKANQRIKIEQLDRKGTSCPLLYAWRDDGWRFITDFLGGAAVGYQQAPGKFNTPDADETIKIVGGLTEVDGTYRVRLNNQLEEVIWFDQVELVVVDHPVGTELFPDEQLMPGPPYSPFRLFASGDLRPVVTARDPKTDRDWTATVAEVDRNYVDNFELLPFKGYANSHTLELDLGPFDNDARIVLLLDGWIDYADSSSNVAAHQAGVSIELPRLQVADERGNFHPVDKRVGFPAGLPKTMTLDLTGLFAGDDHRLRIVTSMRLYWDRIQIMVGGETIPLDVQRIAAQSADLRNGGFPTAVYPGNANPPVYLPEKIIAEGGWKTHLGHYTGFGDVESLLRAKDNAFVTTRSGDEIELVFPAPAPPRRGMTRTFLLYTSGFGKDMDPNSAVNTSLGPIPFHGMPGYPYGDDIVRPGGAVEWSRPSRVVFVDSTGMPGVLPQVLVRPGS